MKRSLLMLFSSFAVLLSSAPLWADPPAASLPARVQWQRTMREMFATGDVSGKVPLAPLLQKPHLWAIGPGAGLQSELLVWDGTVYESRVKPGGAADNTPRADVTAAAGDTRAVFLVYAYVPRWQGVPVPAGVKTYRDLEGWIKKAARARDVDVSQPFPFRLSGTAPKVTYHIVRMEEDGTPFTHEKHDRLKWHDTLTRTPVQMLGFYGERHAGVFVHHTQFTHVHVRSDDGRAMGHVEDMTLGAGMTLYLPQTAARPAKNPAR